MRKVGVGIIGAGKWGEIHARTYSEHPYADLVAIADIVEEKARSLAKKYGARAYFKDYRDMLKNPEIEAVSIVVPDFLHREPAVAAAEAGKHILVEKPLATTVEDAEAILKASRRAGVMLMVDFHNRWNPPFASAKASIDDGEIGFPSFIYMRHSNTIYIPTQYSGWFAKSSIAFWLGSHSVDLVRWLVKDEVRRVFSVSRSRVLINLGVNTPDFYFTIAEFKGGAVAAIENAWILPNTLPMAGDFRAEIIGSEGTIYIDVIMNRLIQKFTKDKYTHPDSLIFPIIHGKSVGFAKEAIIHFIECVAEDREPLATGEDGLAVTKILCAITKSAEENRPIDL